MIMEARFDLGDFELQSGEVLRDAFIGYESHGELNADNRGLIGEDHALDPSKYFIVVPDQFCNGHSSSPSNTPAPYDWLHLEGIKAAMQADAAWAGGDYDSQPEKGFRAFMTVAAG